MRAAYKSMDYLTYPSAELKKYSESVISVRRHWLGCPGYAPSPATSSTLISRNSLR